MMDWAVEGGFALGISEMETLAGDQEVDRFM
jgi:hypothetical protein